jgi:pimeloyl-ACP methyl ester carboxylesterase
MRLINLFTTGCLILFQAAGCAHAQAPPATLIQDWGRQKTFDYHGIKINYYEAGQGPPVILLHGFVACAYTWRHLIPPLAEQHRVFTLDLKGHGYSDRPADGHYALSDQAEMVADFIQRQGRRDLVIMGHSMGGVIALMTYLKLRDPDPGCINKLVLIDSPGYPQKLPWGLRLVKIPGLNRVLSPLLSTRFASALVLKKCYYNKEAVTEEQIDTYAYFGSLPGTAAVVRQTTRQLVPAKNEIEALIAQYQTIKVPVLIIWGKEDDVVPLEVGEKLKRDIPNSQLVVLPRCGHIPPEEEPLATREAILDFLKR